MPTLRLDAYSKGYPSITNRIKASVLSSTSPYPTIASIIDTTVGHPQRVYTFLGLPRNNYGFSLDEIDGSGIVVNNLAYFAVSPGTIEGSLNRDDEQIKVGTTTGFDDGLNTVTFDGTGGKPNYIGWEIVPSELTGRGILALGLDYSWDKLTGIFTLLQAGDILATGTIYNIHFNPINNPAGNSYPTITDFEILYIDTDTIMDDTYAGKKVIIQPLAVYLECTLPDIDTIPDGRKLMIEHGGEDITCVKYIPQGSTIIRWLNGNLYSMTNESFSIYKYSRPGYDPEWRVCEADGNFKTVGESVGDEQIQSGVFNKQLMDGSIKLVSQYARIYNELVLQLPGAQVCAYADWSTGNNKYLFSLDDGLTEPSFHFPDRRDLFEKNNKTGKAGDYTAESVNTSGLDLKVTVHQGNSYTGNGGAGIVGRGSNSPNDFDLPVVGSGTGTITQPSNYLINKYIRI